MKKVLITLSIVTILTACNNKKQDATEPAVIELNDTTATNTTEVTIPSSSKHADGEVITIEGRVTEIINGKDGYTAKIHTPSGEVYSATVSIANMDDPKQQYKTVKMGEDITVTGEVVNLESDVLIKVTELKKNTSEHRALKYEKH
ncbi:lipoprotein [Flavobacterium arcticum]|nr:lipoprotein [Flavobacterium arcticum]KAF2509626.1 lipoprotein [Flavobacterium arcticum]